MMLLEKALEKAERVVGRLEAGGVVDPALDPLALYMFGSAARDEEKPRDVDLILIYRKNDRYDGVEAYTAMAYGRNDYPEGRTIRDLRKGMKMVEIHMYTDREYEFPAGPYRLLWEAEN